MVRTIVNYNAYLGYNSFIINDIIENNAYLATLIHNLSTLSVNITASIKEAMTYVTRCSNSIHRE